MLKIIFSAVLSLLSVSGAMAQEKSLIMPPPDVFYSPETQNYTYVVRDDGSAQAWMRADGVTVPRAGGEYKFTLPEGSKGEVRAWFRENGCRQYRGEICTMYGGNEWRGLTIKNEGREITASFPERQVDERDLRVPVTVGLMYGMERVTTDKWWGREVKITTGEPSAAVSYLYVGVYVPDGVYVRDTQQGPKGWGQAITMLARSESSAALDKAALPVGQPAMFDYAGGGEIYRSRPNLAPGEAYSFSFMSSSSIWKMFAKEMIWGVVWLTAIAVVFSLLLYMIVGKKSLRWYLGVMILLIILMLLVVGLWFSYQLNFGRGGGDFRIMNSEVQKMDAGVAPAGPVDDSTVEIEPLPPEAVEIAPQ